MKTDNTIAAYHIIGSEDGALKLNLRQLYHWNIPKRLRHDPIQKGEIVQVSTKKGRKNVLVMDVFREEFEETGKRYEKVVKIVEKLPVDEVSSTSEHNES